ncbi:hypothetical protein RvY_03467-1 [Ramazzottius varieornatus]|uniref:Uncharacterized protein n=1 Tax=Ramazzottius varieornatus TaxID=947166 RepID=A0A1D1UN67_RAMVA|nr:hypothetical protein RvY_03467-1 [Ramazzottius varieornatus]
MLRLSVLVDGAGQERWLVRSIVSGSCWILLRPVQEVLQRCARKSSEVPWWHVPGSYLPLSCLNQAWPTSFLHNSLLGGPLPATTCPKFSPAPS